MKAPSNASKCRRWARTLYKRARRWRAIGYPDVAASLEADARGLEVRACAYELRLLPRPA